MIKMPPTWRIEARFHSHGFIDSREVSLPETAVCVLCVCVCVRVCLCLCVCVSVSHRHRHAATGALNFDNKDCYFLIIFSGVSGASPCEHFRRVEK